jgi:hypothetical protein
VIRGRAADERSDIYSLGCVVYEMLAGRPPFTGELAASVMHQHSVAPPPSLREVNPAVPEALEALVMRMLAKRPADRPQQARPLAQALPGILEAGAGATAATAAIPLRPTEATRALPRTAAPPPRPDGAPRRRDRAGGSLWLTAAAVAALVILGLALSQVGGSPPQRTGARSAASHTTAARSPRASTAAHRASAASARRAARPTVAAAAGALTSLITADLQSGKIPAPAAQQLLGSLQAVLAAFAGGNPADAVQRAGALSALETQLADHGQIAPTTLAPIAAATSTLGTALARAVSTTPTRPASPPPAQPPPHGKAKGHKGPGGNGQGNGDGGD